MSLETQASSPTPPFAAGHTPRLRPWIMVVGICLVAMPIVQGYLALQPYMALAPFMPTYFVVEQVLSALKWGHAALLSGIAMLVGGALLALDIRKVGAVLAMVGLGFSVIWTTEMLLFALLSLAKTPDQFGPMIEIAMELMAMTYFLPVIFFCIQWVFLIFLLRRGTRVGLQIERRQLLIAGGLLLLLLIDSHLSLLFTFLTYQ